MCVCRQLNPSPPKYIFPTHFTVEFPAGFTKRMAIISAKNSNQFVFITKTQCASVMWEIKHLMSFQREYNERALWTHNPCRVPIITAIIVRVIRRK